MRLLIDIGNTNTGIVLEEKNKTNIFYFIKTSRKLIEPVSLKRLLGKNLKRIDTILIVSVVPIFLEILTKSLGSIFPEIIPKVVGRDLIVPLKIKYDDPNEVGQDRLLVSFSAKSLFATPVLIIDFGTAVTFDLVNEKGEYEGGLIFPGIRLSLNSLTDNAALLPHIELKDQFGLIGKSTRDSMNKGILFGYAEMCDGMILRFKEIYGPDLQVVATGGDASLIAKNSKYINQVNSDLLFSGLSLLL